ncbi:MAG TPA: hypothetical protein VKF84_14925 [Candidatus Sulfotelmatobacter sp.]|nr:hypothetical protein [Candidatus Sulfotelmatobacter sp.]
MQDELSSARTSAVNITTEPAIPTSIVPASATGLFGRVNSASRTSGSFGALCAEHLAAPSAHAAPTAAMTGPARGMNGAQKPAGKATAATPPTTKDPRQNNIPAAFTGALPQFLPTTVPAAAPWEAALPEVATDPSPSPAAGSNAANSPANRSSQISPGTLASVSSPPSATEPAGTALNTLCPDSTLPAASAACRSDISGTVPSGSPGAPRAPQDYTQSATDATAASTTLADTTAARIETDTGLTPLPPIPQTSPQQPAGQSAAEKQSATPQPPPLSGIFPTAARTPGTSAMPRFATEPRPTPAPSDAAPLAIQSANSSSSSSVVPLPSPAPSGNLLGKNSNLTSPSGNRSFPPTAAGGSSPSAEASPTVTATSAAEDHSQSNTAGNGAPDSSPHKTAAVAAAQTVASPASLPAAGSSSADPTAPSAMPAAAQGTPQGIPPGLMPGLMPGMSGPPSAPGSARQPDSSGPAGSDSPLNLPASAELPTHPAAGPVQMAQIVNQAAQSEMRIGMSTSAFGNVEVRTVVHANDVGVLIGSEKGDLRALLSNELPGIASTLQQQNLHLNQVNFHQAGFAFSNQMSSGGEAQPRGFASRTVAAVTRPAEASSAESSEPPAVLSSGSGTGLSILA